jgi:DNA integrity scanning protein DisA with diadenylate cyclase activity
MTAPRVIERLCSDDRHVDKHTLEQVVMVAVELAREGREGRKVGTLMVLGDTDAVLALSRPLIFDPLAGHDEDTKRIGNPDLRETLKELALLDGGFVIRDDGVVISAARYFDVSSEGVTVPLGLGTRHIAAASITKRTDAVAIVVSESSVVRLFDDGKLVSEILPELWMLHRQDLHLVREGSAPETEGDLTVVREPRGS